MPQLLDCPSCSRKLRVPDDLLGTRVQCPSCSTTFDALASPPPLPESDPPGAPSVQEAPPKPTPADGESAKAPEQEPSHELAKATRKPDDEEEDEDRPWRPRRV